MSKRRFSIGRWLSAGLITGSLTAGLILMAVLGLAGEAAAATPRQEPPTPPALPSAPPGATQPVGPEPDPTPSVLPTVAQPAPPPPTAAPPDEPPAATPPAVLPPLARPARVVVVAIPGPGAPRAGEALELTVVIKNLGEGRASDARVTLPLDPTRLQVTGFGSADPDAWVSRHTPDQIELRSGPLAGRGGLVTATLRLRALADLPVGAAATERLRYSWSDGADGGGGASNLPTLTETRARYPLAVTPASGPAGTSFSFSSELFAPGEPVGLWYNSPAGRVFAEPTYAADAAGGLAISFDSTGLPPGAYSLVFYGHWTEFTVVATFVIT